MEVFILAGPCLANNGSFLAADSPAPLILANVGTMEI